ncbi:MAG TPA: Gfo/Idh/MocA family oxidoreductase [Armatimonadetes bacterium]|nr:Gfo/Idh/MocA family oxidoreductase [Armatimonadota bacterium]
MSKIGIGILSYAHGHVHTYSQVLSQREDVRLVACWDDDEARGRAAAERYGLTYTPHLEDVLGHGEVEAVIIASETNKHADLCVAAAEAGKAILLQKPMALTLADCDRIIEAVERNGVWFSLAFQMRHDPLNRKMKELVDAGEVGRVGVLRRRHCISVLFSEAFVTGPTRWHIDPVANMGMFMDDASHAADFILWFLGMPVSVMAEIDNLLTKVAPDDTGVAVYRFASGAMAILLNSSVTLAGENTTEIYGDQGVIIQNHDDGPSTANRLPQAVPLKLFRRATNQWEVFDLPLPDSHGARIAGVPGPFIEALKNDLPPTVTAREGRHSTEMILGAYQSAREGHRVTFPLE